MLSFPAVIFHGIAPVTNPTNGMVGSRCADDIASLSENVGVVYKIAILFICLVALVGLVVFYTLIGRSLFKRIRFIKERQKLKEATNIASKHDGTANVTSKHDGTTNITTKLDGTTNVISKHDETTNVASKYDGTTNITSKHDGTMNVTSKNDETTNVAAKYDETTIVAAKHDGTANIASKHDCTTNVAPKHDETTNITSKRNGTTEVSSKHDRKMNVAFKQDRITNVASTQDGTTNESKQVVMINVATLGLRTLSSEISTKRLGSSVGNLPVTQETKMTPGITQRKRIPGYRLSVMFMVITLVFILSSLPKATMMLFESRNELFWLSRDIPLSGFARYRFLYTVYIINSVVNPFVYGFYDRQFRQELVSLCMKH